MSADGDGLNAHGGCHAPPASVSEASPNRSDLDRQIDALETKISKTQSELAALRRIRPPETVKDYAFTDWNGGKILLSQLSGEQTDLIVVHNMGAGCAYCTLWADGFVGLLPYLQSRAAFVVASPDPIDVQKQFARSRGWHFYMVSAHGTSFFHDMGFTDTDDAPMPGVSVFRRRDDGTMMRIQRAEFFPGDQFCAVWHFFDLLADGAHGWQPSPTS